VSLQEDTIFIGFDLERSVLWCARKRNDVSDVGHPCGKQHQAFEPKTKARMRGRSPNDAARIAGMVAAEVIAHSGAIIPSDAMVSVRARMREGLGGSAL